MQGTKSPLIITLLSSLKWVSNQLYSGSVAADSSHIKKQGMKIMEGRNFLLHEGNHEENHERESSSEYTCKGMASHAHCLSQHGYSIDDGR